MASYPQNAVAFTAKVDLLDLVRAQDVNQVYDEVTAIASDLGSGTGTGLKYSGTWGATGTLSTSTTWTGLQARLQNIENGVYSAYTYRVDSRGGSTILSSAVGVVGLTFRLFTSQTADVLRLRNATDTTTILSISTAGTLTTSGNIITTGTAQAQIIQVLTGGSIQAAAGTVTSAPVKLTTGVNLTTAVGGSLEYDGTNLYFTPSTATPVRKTIAYIGDAGYTQLSQTTVNSTGTDYSTTIAVSDYTYRKLVITIEVTAYTSGGSTRLKVNNSGSGFFGYDFTRTLYSSSGNVGTLDGTYQGNGGFSLGSASGTNSFYTIELPNYWSTLGWKHITSQGTGVFLHGLAETDVRISNLYVVTTGTFTYTLTVYGVK